MLHLRSFGEGFPVVLIHGFCENSTCFDQQVLLLKGHFRLHLIDLPGVGNSPDVETLSMEQMADEVHRVLIHHKITGAVMIGHSMGGYVTLAFARKYRNLLKGISLLHSTARPDTEERRLKRDQAIHVIQEKGVDFYIRQFIPPLFAPTFSNPELIAKLTDEALRTTPDNVIAQLNAMKNRHSGLDFLRETDLPVQFIVGAADPIIPVKDIADQAALVRRGSISVLPHTAHMGMLEAPEGCAESISGFVNYCHTF